MGLHSLLDGRLVLITGKGGTGKTSLACALAGLAAERGRRTLVAEVDCHRPATAAIFGVDPGYEPTVVASDLAVLNITWHEALEEWLGQTVPAQRIVKLILSNRMVQLFLDATPGAREVVILSKMVGLSEEWDLVVVDMSASGHALSMLRVPRIVLRMMKAGPIRRKSQDILAALGRAGTKLVLVALPEEMVVNETLETWAALRKQIPQLDMPLIVLNRAVSPSLTDDEVELLNRLHDAAGRAGEDAAAVSELLQAGRWEASLEAGTAEALERFEGEARTEVLQCPRLGVLGGFEGGPVEVVRQLKAHLAREALKVDERGAEETDP